MELRWYWRVLQRQARVIWTCFIVVAVLAAAYTAYSWHGTRYKVNATIEFYEQPPIVRGTSTSLDANSLALANAGGATGDTKLYTEQHAFFQGISDRLLKDYGEKMDYKTIQAGLGANIVGGRQLELEYKSSGTALPEHIITIAIEQISTVWLPGYNADVVQPGTRGNITTYPIMWRLYDPINTKTQSGLSTVSGWVLKSLLGLVLGVALAFLWEYLDESIQDEHDVRGWMQGAPTLGVIPGGKSRVA